MNISCPCGAKLKISDEKLTSVPVKVKCPRCGTLHAASRPAAASAGPPEAGARQEPAVPTAPAMPWFAPAVPTAPKTPLVLIAHDSKAVAEMIAGVLSGSGMSTDYAANGLEALKKAGSLRPQAMIVDVGLTGIYGFELCERLKGDPDTSSIKIILLSSVYGLTSYKRAPETLYGADDYIEKHHIPDKLLPKLRELFAPIKPKTGPPAEQLVDRRPAPPEPAPAASPVPRPPLISRKGILQEPAPPSAPDAEQDLRGLLGPEADFPPIEREPSKPEVLPGTGVRNIPAPRPAELRMSAEADRDRSAPPTVIDASSFAAEVLAPQREPDVPAGTTARPSGETPEPAAPQPSPEPEQEQAPSVMPPAAAAVEVEAVLPGGPAGPEGPEKAAASDAAAQSTAAFFQRDEFPAPPAAPVADPDAIEKARRFARLIVSDIALYNQEAVAEGIGKGTFYELLQEDITEGRAVYEQRVPEPIRATGDYLQEAFDNFIASKKKRR